MEFTRPNFGPIDEVYMMADFAVPTTRYKRLSRLIVMLAVSAQTGATITRLRQIRTRAVITTAFTDKPVDALSSLVKQAGFTQESFEACLKRQDIYDAVTVVKDGGAKAGVDSTPTFFINGQKRSGALTIAEFDKILEPLLGN